MIRSSLSIAAALAIAPAAIAAPDTDYPHRDWGQEATLDMSLIEATACVARELNRIGDATVIPAEGGNDVDWAMRGLFGVKQEPWLSFKLREAPGATVMRVFYRKPMSKGKVDKEIRRQQRRCLRVRSIAPHSP